MKSIVRATSVLSVAAVLTLVPGGDAGAVPVQTSTFQMAVAHLDLADGTHGFVYGRSDGATDAGSARLFDTAGAQVCHTSLVDVVFTSDGLSAAHLTAATPAHSSCGGLAIEVSWVTTGPRNALAWPSVFYCPPSERRVAADALWAMNATASGLVGSAITGIRDAYLLEKHSAELACDLTP